MFTLTAAQIKSAIEDAKAFDLEELVRGSNQTIDKQLKRGLLEESEANQRKEEIKSFYEKQQSEAIQILELIDSYKK